MLTYPDCWSQTDKLTSRLYSTLNADISWLLESNNVLRTSCGATLGLVANCFLGLALGLDLGLRSSEEPRLGCCKYNIAMQQEVLVRRALINIAHPYLTVLAKSDLCSLKFGLHSHDNYLGFRALQEYFANFKQCWSSRIRKNADLLKKWPYHL